jgi:hypothetical protein
MRNSGKEGEDFFHEIAVDVEARKAPPRKPIAKGFHYTFVLKKTWQVDGAGRSH